MVLCLTLSTSSVFAARNSQVELISVSRDQDKLQMLVDSRVTIQFEFDTKNNGKSIRWTLKGADYSFDIDSLLDCMDNLVIVPLSKNAARFEADLGSQLSASIVDSTAPSGAHRLILELRPTSNSAPCFDRPIPEALIAAPGLFAPTVPVPSKPSRSASSALPVPTPPVAAAAAEIDHELTAEDIVKAQQRDRERHSIFRVQNWHQFPTSLANRKLMPILNAKYRVVRQNLLRISLWTALITVTRVVLRALIGYKNTAIVKFEKSTRDSPMS